MSVYVCVHKRDRATGSQKQVGEEEHIWLENIGYAFSSNV